MNSTDTRNLDEYIMNWNIDEPLIGLNYIVEYQRDGGREPMYECMLCDFTGYMHIFVLHLVGFKHRMNYMTKEYPEMMKLDTSKLKHEELCDIIKERAVIIQKLEGKKSIQVVRGHDLPSTVGMVKRVPLPGNSWQQEWEKNPLKMEQNLMEGIRNLREQSMRNEIMFSTPRDGQYGADVRTSDTYSDLRRDGRDLREENMGATDRFTDKRMQYRENVLSGYTDWNRDKKEPYVESTVSYDQYSNQRVYDRGGLQEDRVQEAPGYVDWKNVHQPESENYFRSSDRYSNVRKDEQPLYQGAGRGTDYRKDDRKYEDEYSAREQTGKLNCMEQKCDFAQPQNFSDVIDLKRKNLYDYLQSFKIKSEDDASFVLKVTKAFKDALIRYYQRKENDPAIKATFDQRATRSIGALNDYSRYNPDVSTSAVRVSESSRGVYDWKQDSLPPTLRQSHDPTSYQSSTTPGKDSALYSSNKRYSTDYKSNTRDVNWGPNASNAFYSR
ncbi:uncharacterized protein LOC144606894 isoform X2 [Rhinoraja longicauda]